PQDAYQVELGGKGLLTLFLVLAIICGLFFAFGYTIGKHAIPTTFALGSASVAATNPLAPANSLGGAAAAPAGVQPPNAKDLGSAEANQTPPTLTPDTTNSAAAAAAGQPPAAVTTQAAAKPTAPAAAGSASAQGVYAVQVFAGGQSDAESLATALKARGYPANVVAPEANGGDNLYRVQVGPYLTIAEAQAMRSRLTADGYQAVVKQ
ncbi:MAG TPA: SPOR domain-containing protein, partial [Candidatus Sulfopaludibacter sp.]|nr:SPOR domain-containing protein [Candidatus Sulfopaludibacter sp.]